MKINKYAKRDLQPLSKLGTVDATLLKSITDNITPAGEGGLSAYQLAVQQGYVGTLNEWLVSLKGEKGDRGSQGMQGEQGLPGEDGKDGMQGPQGIPGSDADVTEHESAFAHANIHAPGSDDQDLSSYVQTTDARLSDARIPLTHSHPYEPANVNIQSHVTSAHAPANAQANADITKAEIEAKLTGTISTHSHAGGADPFMAKLVLGADKPTGANTTPVTLGLSFNYEANSKYIIDLYMIVAPTAATTGCGFLLDVSSVVTYIGMFASHQLANTGTVSGSGSIGDTGTTSQGVSSGMPSTGSHFVYGGGILITGANAGTATFFFRSETTAVTTCKANSIIRVMKV